jgi:RNA polymerase sigma-70 factor, ECF subfamily
MDDTSDINLVEETLRGSLGAYETLIRRHERRIFYVGLKFHKNYEDAEDFTQEVFLKAYEKLGTFSRNVPFSAWLYRIGYNHGINRISRKQTFELPDETAEQIPDLSAVPEAQLVREEERGVVGRILERLPEMYTMVIKMRFFDDLSYAEIAEIIGKPVNTIKSHIFRAKELVKQAFEKYL